MGRGVTFTPLKDNVLVEIIKEEKTKSGIYLPDNFTQEGPQNGIVVAVGKGRLLDNGELLKPTVSVGDKVLFGQYAGTEIMVENKNYLLLAMVEIMGIWED